MKNRVKELRDAKHLTQTGLALKVGSTQQTISKIEREIGVPKLDLALIMADFFNVTLEYLFCLSDKKHKLEHQIEIDRDVLLIYVSSYETYFMQLFEVEPFRFIKKPIKETEFEEVIDFAYERIIEEDAYFEYKYNKTVGKVLIRKIMYFESAGRIVNIHTEESTYRYYGKLDEVERRLVQNKIPFLRIHKSFYVNFHFVDKITFSKLILSDGTVLQISQDRQNIIRKRYLDILGGTLNE